MESIHDQSHRHRDRVSSTGWPALAFLVLVGLVFALGAPRAVAGAPRVDAVLSVAKIQSDGRRASTSAADARPGDVLEYATRFANRGDTSADGLMPTLPIPDGTEYVPTADAPQPTLASLDGSTWQPIPLHRRVRDRDGVLQTVDVPPREYRAVRWTVGSLAPGGEVTVRARVRVALPATSTVPTAGPGTTPPG